MRFAGHLRSIFDIDDEARGVLVPVLLLQPLAENAIKHGFGGLAVGGTVQRDGAPRSAIGSSSASPTMGAGGRHDRRPINEGVGLANTRQRLEHLYPGAHSDRRRRAGGRGRLPVTIRLPWRPTPPKPLDDALDIPA